MKNDGKYFEEQTKIFFSFLFKKLGYIVHKERMQFNGTQDGFDIQFIIGDQYIEKNIFIECKDYSTDLKFGNIYAKAHDLESNYDFNKNDIALFISPRANFGNNRNPEKSEPVFNNRKFDFYIRLLELNNGVDKLFAIDPNVYEKIYKKKCTLNVDVDYELENFKSILFSRGPLKKIIIRDNDRLKYLTDIQKKEYYITRTLSFTKSAHEEQNSGLFLKDNSNTITLVEATQKLTENNEKVGLVLLGNPGMGKSVELEELSIYYWENREVKNWIPFYREINNFQSTDKISDFLPTEWNNIPQLLIILDGLDEIAHGQEFRAKLEKFIVDNQTEFQKIKFVLSCRTNIYENVIRDIAKFDSYFLDNISYPEALQYLDKKFGLSFDNYIRLSFNEEHKEFFENPYYLGLFGEYYVENKKLPNNKSDLLEKYVSKRLEDDRKLKYKNKSFDKSIMLNSCKKVALSLEAMREIHIKDSSLHLLLNSFKNDFINSCFIEKVFDKDNWKFEHRNLQEFFAAKALENLSFEQIIKFLKLDESTNKTHPSWLNSISYLINLLDKESELYNKFITWLSEHDSEVLFKADANRIPNEIKVKVFQNYFKKRCKEQKLWIRSYDSGVLEVARFGDCNENIVFLKSELANKNNHRRVRISSIDLLSYMDLKEHKDEIRNLVISLIASPVTEVDIGFKSDLLNVSERLEFYKTNDFILEIIEVLGEIDSPRVTSALLRLIEKSNREEFFEYIKLLTPKILDDSKRKYKNKRNYITSEKDTLKRIFRKFSNINALLFSLKIGIYNEYRFELTNKDLENIITKIVKVYEKDNSVFDSMITFVLVALRNKNHLFHFEEIIASFFHKTKTNEKAFRVLYQSGVELNIKRYLMAYLPNANVIRFYVDEYKDGKLEDLEITYFRNVISKYDFELGKSFESLILAETGFNFKEDYLDQELRDKWAKFHKTQPQLNFDILFNKKEIKKILKDYFSHLGKKTITYDDSEDNREGYWESIELRLQFPQAFINITYDALRYNDGSITIHHVNELLDSELYLINQIKKDIKSNQKELVINDFHREYIMQWCLENLSKANFEKAYDSGDYHNYVRCELLSYFRNTFDFTFPERNLLDMLHVDEIEDNTGKGFGHDYVLKHVEKSKIDDRIVANIQEGISTDFIFENHALYAIDNNLEQVYPIIKRYIEDDQKGKWSRKKILQKYFDKTNDIDLLKRLVKPSLQDERVNDLTWEAIELLLKKNKNEFVVEKLTVFMDVNDAHKNELIVIKYLVRSNYKNAIKFLIMWIQNGNLHNRNNHLSTDDFKIYTNSEAIMDLIELIKINYDNRYKFDEIDSPIRFVLEAFKNICENNDPQTCLEIINLVNECKIELNDSITDLFYINTMINDIWKIYYKLKSKPMPFTEIATKIKEYEFHFV